MKMGTKNKIESWLAPLAKRLPIPPNIITLLSVLVMLAAGYQVLKAQYIAAGLLVLLSGFLDMLDGAVAKSRGKSSALGALLDRTADRAADFILLSSFLLAGLVPLWLGLAVLFLVITASYVAACIEAFTKTKVGEALSWRAIRLLIITGFLVFLPARATELFYILGAIGAYALAERLWQARKLLK